MKRLLGVAVLLVCALSYTTAPAVNSVVVESRTLVPSQTGAEIRIKVANDFEMSAIELPLELREITPGAFVTGLSLGFSDRLARPSLSYIDIRDQFAEALGVPCTGGTRPGYLMPPTYNGDAFNPVGGSPEGILFVVIGLSESIFFPGADGDGSFVVTVDAGATTGQFMIDTTCVEPQSRLRFIDAVTSGFVVPSFTPGIITIRTNNPPVAGCVDVTVYADNSCAADANIESGSFDPDGDALTFSQDPPGPYPGGATTVTLTATDEFGLSSTCQAVVTVADTIPPTIACPPDFEYNADCGVEGAVVVMPVAAATDNCPGVTISYEPPSGSFLPVGTTTVTATATDVGGNTASCSFDVTVRPNVLTGTLCNMNPRDVNCDGKEDVLDVVLIVGSVFRGDHSLEPCCINP